jgi:hypothetical protein
VALVRKILWFYQKVGIPIGTNFAPLLADLFLYSYKADFIQGLLKKNEKKLARGKFTMGNQNHLFCRKVSFLTAHHCQCWGVGQGMKQMYLYLWYPLFQTQLDKFFIGNIFFIFCGRIFQQTIGIPMGTNSAPLLANLFLYSYEADFIQWLLKKNEKKLARSFNFTFRYVYDVLSLNNSSFK